MLRRPALIALAIALVVPLAACVESTRIPDAAPSSDEAPLFASDEEALAAATAAYEEYLVASNAVTASADLNITPIKGLVTEVYLASERDALEQFETQGLRTKGQSALAGAELQQWFQDGDGIVTVIIYACVDVSMVRINDLEGADVTPADRSEFAALEVEMRSQEEALAPLLVNSSTPWQGTSVCG